MTALLYQLFQRMAADEIQQRKKKNPDNIDEVPIESEVIDGRSMPVDIRPVPRLVEQNEQNTDTDDHVQGVHASHGKVKKEVELRMLSHVRRQRNIPLVGRVDKVLHAEACPRDVVFDVFVVILHGLDAQEDQP